MSDISRQTKALNSAAPSRRAFLAYLAVLSAQASGLPLLAESGPGTSRTADPDVSPTTDLPPMSYMDGYHGGIEGHMPPGSWRDILSALREFPEWKISLDIEPRSWVVLRERDPEAFAELAQLLVTQGKANRVEMVGGTFAQPYGWALSGESNVRQMQYGLALIQKSFPGIRVRNYVVQEPCWASCLPQILLSLGFSGACLKNASTAWGGYTAGFDAETVQWTGPDGSAIRAVPRYALERLQHVYETESIDATADFAHRCIEHGITHPAGMCLQDLGWTAKPRLAETQVTFRTWQQYFDLVVEDPAPAWHFTPEDILVALPWGDATLRTVAQQVRSAEIAIVSAERMAAMAAWLAGTVYPQEALRNAWERLLLAQAHDAWITATTRHGREAWAFQVAANTLACQDVAESVLAASATALAGGSKLSPVQVPVGEQVAFICNPLGTSREEVVSIPLATDPGTRSVVVETADGTVVAVQQVVDRRYASLASLEGMSRRHDIAAPEEAQAGINHLTLLAKVRVPGFGYTTLRLRPGTELPATPQAGTVTAGKQEDGTWVIESDLYRIVVDPMRGGTIRNLICKQQTNRDVVEKADGELFGEYKAYLIEEGGWHKSGDTPGKVTCEESGPVRVVLRIESTVGSIHLTTRLQVCVGEPRLDFAVTMHVDHPTWIGDPYEPKAADHLSDPRRSQHDGRWKLQVLLPSARHGTLFKSAAYDVCRSKVKSTSFQRWDEIRHNIIAQWVDVVTDDGLSGLALMTDHTTAYNFDPGQPLGLVLGWAWEGSFWWGKHPLTEEATVHFALLPHGGDWEKAGVPAAYSRFCEPLLSAISTTAQPSTAPAHSLVDVGTSGLELAAAQMEGDHLILRLFNAGSAAREHRIQLGFVPARVEEITLAGTPIGVLKPEVLSATSCTLRISLAAFGLCTLRCAGGKTEFHH